MSGQMYVERLSPVKSDKQGRPPVILMHGAGFTGHCWLETADGRPGWGPRMVDYGWVVYVTDQPDRGRSGWSAEFETSNFRRLTVEDVERRFTACASYAAWDGASGHSQWPGTGLSDDPVFQRFYATTVPFVADPAESQRRVRDASVELLNIIGPAVLVTHSQSGPQGWVIADAIPEQVRAIVALEPAGPPWKDFFTGEEALRFGITDIALTTQVRRQCFADSGDFARLLGIPILIVTGSASYHEHYDCRTVALMSSGGLNVEHMHLRDHGIIGNAHMMQVEANSEAVLQVILEWLNKTLGDDAGG